MQIFDLQAIAALGVPVLCIDTCSVLDIMRDPTRDDSHPHHREVAINLVDRMEAGEIVCIVAEQVEREFNDHDHPIQAEARAAVERLRQRVEQVNEIHGTLLPPVPIDLLHFDAVTASARQIVGRVLDISYRSPGSADINNRAIDRVNRNIAPARRGKDSIKDCIVLETYLETMSVLRGEGLLANAVFLSSNSKEYQEGRALKPDLQPDFARTNLAYATNMGQARAYLGF
ncbi:PIN domain-containing protein [Sandaracinobacteroides hominis]|uniref:PIN domain-containing protein n=1 Tax=Sandaracinobacteroides hominis TaxID=2780086 RepID=UPI0018F2DD74|nr:PIN domain-containing protein [Sandaracinobacteroides hominis]